MGLISLDRETQKDEINLIRPLINTDKKDLIYISNMFLDHMLKIHQIKMINLKELK